MSILGFPPPPTSTGTYIMLPKAQTRFQPLFTSLLSYQRGAALSFSLVWPPFTPKWLTSSSGAVLVCVTWSKALDSFRTLLSNSQGHYCLKSARHTETHSIPPLAAWLWPQSRSGQSVAGQRLWVALRPRRSAVLQGKLKAIQSKTTGGTPI